MSMDDTTAARQSIIDGCLWMQSVGLNQGTSGNISLRVDDGLLITPSAIPYADMTPDMIVRLSLHSPPDDTQSPSSEWHFHQAVYQQRPDVQAIVHAHPAHATAVAIQRRAIPSIHYMIAAFGGGDVPCCDYALFGTDTLSAHVVDAMTSRHGCLMANHGALTVGDTLARALWRMEELESLARLMLLSEQGDGPVLLSDEQIADALAAFKGYGLRSDRK